MCLIKGFICWWIESWCYQNARYNNKKKFIYPLQSPIDLHKQDNHRVHLSLCCRLQPWRLYTWAIVHVSFCCRIKRWRLQTGAAAHLLLPPRQLHRHTVHQNHHPHPLGRHLQHRHNKKQRYILPLKKATNTPSPTAVSSHNFWYFAAEKDNPLWPS